MSLGGIVKRAKRSVKKAISNPGRILTAAATGGTSELVRAVDGATGDNLRNLVNPDIPNASDGLRAEEARSQKAIQDRINRLRAAYGEGDGPDAQAAQAGIDRYIAQLSGESEGAAIADAGDSYQGNLRAIDEGMFAAGLQGGTADLEARRAALEGFVRQRQQIANAAKTAGQQTRSALSQERLGLEREISQGTQADPAWNTTSAQRKANLAGSWQQAWQQQLGTLVDGAGAAAAWGINNGSMTPTPQQRVARRDQANVDTFNAYAR